MNNYHNNSKRKKLYNSQYELLNLFQAAKLLNTNTDTILYYIQNNELPYITEIKSLNEPIIYKRDLINFANSMGIPINNSYKKEYENILQNYSKLLDSTDIRNILDLKNSGISFYIMKNNKDINSEFHGNKIYVEKEAFKNFMWNHRRVHYIEEGYYPSLEDYTNPINLYNQNIPIPNDREIVQPFKFINPNIKINYLDSISLKEN